MSINTNALKAYAPKARKDFIAAMTSRAAKFEITEDEIAEQRQQGDIVIVGADALPKSVGDQRQKLVDSIKKHGFEQAMEAVAYTWFNRLVAIRYMELHGLLDHGYRVLSHPSGKELPEILEHAEHLEFPGLDQSKVIDLKLDGTKDAELYRMLLIAQCNALHRAMPFLFERIDDETELLLPDNLLHSDSLIRKLVAAIDEADWQDIEVIGWLYQFYISEKKDEVFAGLKKNQKITADKIPAATQLFTPHWIVRYLVENSLGRLWLLNRPESQLAEQMDYYIAPEEPETDFLKIGKPEEIKVCDPACGSGHMLTYAFDLLYAIYEEEGYDPKEIPALILKHNLTGIEIDDRAGALAAFALSMKAAEKLGRRRFLRMDVKPDIVVLQDVAFTSEEMTDVQAVIGRDLFTGELRETLSQFEHAKNFGSLIVPKLRDPTETLRVVEARDFSSDLLLKEVQGRVLTVLRMAEVLSPKYHVVVANPPYAGGKGLNENLQAFAKMKYPDSKADLFSMFMERCLSAAVGNGYFGMINLPSWLFLSSFEKLRGNMLSSSKIESLLHMGRGIFGIDWGSTAFTVRKTPRAEGTASFFRLHKRNFQHLYPEDIARIFLKSKADHDFKFDFDKYRGEGGIAEIVHSNDATAQRVFYSFEPLKFSRIPGSPIAFWISDELADSFSGSASIGEIAQPRQGLATSDNNRFLRSWHEVNIDAAAFNCVDRKQALASQKKWFPYNKGGPFRKWYGNNEFFINWECDGKELLDFAASLYGSPTRTIKNIQHYFKDSITWSAISSSKLSIRKSDAGFVFDTKGQCVFSEDPATKSTLLSLLNSTVSFEILKILAPTLDFNSGVIAKIPFRKVDVAETAIELVRIARSDWDAYETSWDFTALPVLLPDHCGDTLRITYARLRAHWKGVTDEMQRLEEQNNRIFIDAYGLQDELTPEVPIEEITLTCNPAYRYGVKSTEDDREERLRSDTMKELISYAIGCMMGRYSLAEPGLIYANAGNEGFDASRYGNFPADDDGIVPTTEVEWFDDDAALRFEEFLKVAWSPETLRENLRFVAEGLAANGGNDPQKTIRNYISKSFVKDHMQTYKKRPIYWLFSSGKLRAFECLVYLHRYNESTLSRMRMEYVMPLTSRIAARIDQLEEDIASAPSSAARNKAQKERDLFIKQLEELREFDEELRYHADQRISLDLDDGVKVNYGKFGNLLADVKSITGEK
jgi:type II restriction/modification system DNA methylase subunit YeeA